MADDLGLDDIRRLAAQAGLTRFGDEHLAQLLRATNASRARVGRIEAGKLGYADEPAQVFRLDAGEAR
jgi:hypothetical protein